MVRDLLPWAAFLAIAWWVLEPEAGAWPPGLVAVGAGLLLRMYAGRVRPTGIRPLRVGGFVPYFLGQSIRGGWDVSRRALSPSMPLAPSVMTYRSTLRSEPARVFFCNALSLLPGTVAADLQDDVLTVHLLSGGKAAEARVQALESRVAELFEAAAG